jgi:glutathione synthase/RimK-type ligase-like ATP-grasp enzyme
LEIPVYPSLEEVLIYENKAYFYEWLKINKLPSAETNLFYYLSEGLNFASTAKYPIVAKLNIGASGDGVSFLKNYAQSKVYLEKAFNSGIRPKSGPKVSKGKIIQRALKVILTSGALRKKLYKYKVQSEDTQKGFVIFQEFIPHEFEWRVVRIGDSFFAHKKLVKKNKASGTLLKNYDDPPLDLLDFVKQITDKFHFYSQAIDIFESENKFIINEMQCMFGQSDNFQMLVGGKPGRYTKLDDIWEFEEGDFNRNESFNLRVAYIVDKMANK